MKKCGSYYTIGFTGEEKDRLISILSGTEFESRAKNAHGCLTFSGREDYSVLVEQQNGEVIRIDDFQCGGLVPEWDDAKYMSENEIETIGYFKNPLGIITVASKLNYYKKKENV